ncbi:MAG: Uma2 family endonuclease [Anaerolineales bacterium]|nr:Uma2 family endonuclease [Anaerolineales bacterium]
MPLETRHASFSVRIESDDNSGKDGEPIMTTSISVPHLSAQNWQEQAVPPLFNGDHLTRIEFERRYKAQSQIKKAELIEGVVYMPSPVHLEKHSKPHSRVVGWLFNYVAATPGTDFGDNATVRLDRENEVQPDAFLRIHETHGGQSHVDEDDYLTGAPELIVEVAASSAAYDLYEKLRVYRRNGVQEYLVLLAYEQETRWYRLVAGEYKLMPPDDAGVIQSVCFPGLHFSSPLFWADDLPGLLQQLQAGLASEAHKAFAAALQAQ